MIYLEGPARIQVTQRIVGQRCKMHHGLESPQILDGDVAEVLPNGRRSVAVASEHAVAKELVVQADDIMTRCLEVGGHDRPDVTLVTSNQNPHQILCTSLGWNSRVVAPLCCCQVRSS